MTRTTVSKLLRILFQPVVRFCIRHGVGFQEALEAYRLELLHAAVSELERKGEKITVSRLSVMTGMQRREVARLHGDETAEPASRSFSQRVLGQWEQDKRFVMRNGKPKVLSYQFDDSEFTSLVRSVSKDLNPSAMLSELERIGAIELSDKGVRLVTAERTYAGDPEKAYDLLARDMETLVRSGEENLEGTIAPKNLHLRTEFDNITVDELPQIRAWLLEQGSALHKKTREYLSRYDQDINPDPKRKGGGKIVLKAFSMTEPGQK